MVCQVYGVSGATGSHCHLSSVPWACWIVSPVGMLEDLGGVLQGPVISINTRATATVVTPAKCACYVVFCIVQAGEPFRVYIVTPMFPEGVPTSGSVQAILYYQAKTRQMMYK